MSEEYTDTDLSGPDHSGPDHCGYVAIVGRPNVGKSTLLNHLLGMKLSITSRKPQTTRFNLLGIKTEGNYQLVFVDTPGMHSNQDKAINRYMNRAADSAMAHVDSIVFVVDRDSWTDADEAVAQAVINAGPPVILVVNKIDRMEQELLLPWLQSLKKRFPAIELVPVSALQAKNLDNLETLIKQQIPAGPHHFPPDQITDRSERFLAAELIREKITRQLGAEVPYETAVEIEEFREEERQKKGKIESLRHISALILVERDGQKKIIIGEKGERLKKIGQQARLDMEKLYGGKVMLKLWVKVRKGWSDDDRALRSLGFSLENDN